MGEIKIKCPTCGKVLRLQEMPNINAATFTCPNCKDKHIVGKCQRFVPQRSNEETQYGNASSTSSYSDETLIGNQSGKNNDETMVGGIKTQHIVGKLVDNMNRIYQLTLGNNTIGRKASTSSATIQVVTNDLTMSRSHAVIDVRNIGGQILHILKNGANKNPSYINDTLINQQDQLVLNNGDRIRMGKTTLIFKL